MICAETAADPGQGTAAAFQSSPLQRYHTDRESCKPQGVTLRPTMLQFEIARSIASARLMAHARCRTPEQDLGPARNRRVEAFGALAELLVYGACEAAGMDLRDFALFRCMPPPGPDCIINGLRFDVKAVLPGSPFLMLNERARLRKATAVDFYLPVAFSPGHCANLFRPIPVSEVATWTLRSDRSAYRSIAVCELAPLTSLSAVCQGGRR